MKISILTPDSKMFNLAAMKISAYHKALGDEVLLNMPLWPAQKTYASVLFEWTPKPIANFLGGPGVDPSQRLPLDIEACRPDYDLYPDMDYSLGYTYRACHRGCDFCKVKDMNEPTDHRSIWDFHDSRFKKIALLNNNTFEDPRWRETFQEIWDAGLIFKDVSGFDVRLMNKERAEALARTRFDGQLHIAWDSMKDKESVCRGIWKMLECGVKPYKIMCYVLVGYDTTEAQDLQRIEALRDWGIDPFVMPYNKEDIYQRKIARWVNHKAIFKTTEWRDYRP
jgi:hypothetical protein